MIPHSETFVLSLLLSCSSSSLNLPISNASIAISKKQFVFEMKKKSDSCTHLQQSYLQDMILSLQNFWVSQGCTLLQPYDMEVGAGTSHPATVLRCLDQEKWNVVYMQPSRRPKDGRYGVNPNRMQHFFQLQVILKPSPKDIQELCLQSLYAIGIDKDVNDLRFVESDWENPTLGACGLGWEIWCNGMEIVQFTYMQQLGGMDLFPIPGEITYGIERLGLYVQKIDNVWDLKWTKSGVSYSDVFLRAEKENCKYNFEHANVEMLSRHFRDYLSEAYRLLELDLAQPAYDFCLKSSHAFNLLEARGAMSVLERASNIQELRGIAKKCCEKWIAGSQINEMSK